MRLTAWRTKAMRSARAGGVFDLTAGDLDGGRVARMWFRYANDMHWFLA